MRLRLLIFVTCLLPTLCASAGSRPTYIWDLRELDSLRLQSSSSAFRQYVRQADQALANGIVAVTDKETTRSGDKHNYESLSIYWWPDPKAPEGPYVARDGEFNPEYKLYDYPRLLRLVNNLTSVCKAFYLTGEAQYYDYVCRQLDAWFVDAQTRMAPHFEYCQFIPGRNDGRGNPQGMIDAYNFNDVLECIRLTDSLRPIGKKRMKALRHWFSDFASWMQTSDYGQRASAYDNNQAVAYDITLYDLYLFAGDKAKRKAILDKFYDKRVGPQIDDEGKMPAELKRPKAYHYSIFNLTHLVDFCLMVDADVFALPSPIVRRIGLSEEFLARFSSNRQQFPYKELGNWESLVELLQHESRRLEPLKEKYP